MGIKEASIMKPGTYVTDQSASGRFYKHIYSVVRVEGDRTLVRSVGPVVNGRIEYERQNSESYRETANLSEYHS